MSTVWGDDDVACQPSSQFNSTLSDCQLIRFKLVQGMAN
jgi:hypothetical protein